MVQSSNLYLISPNKSLESNVNLPGLISAEILFTHTAHTLLEKSSNYTMYNTNMSNPEASGINHKKTSMFLEKYNLSP